MRLKSIKLAGFKSFVDPVTVPFDGNMTAIVGPNGCGKSNVIDAVRWVMGESSAKTLRGESMADVIFNGSTGRSPVGQAAIELLFDNRDGSLGGAYASYAEIAVKRQVTREGQSTYYLNGQKCRRRDIADIFLGTGLGPRSYAIIGQGMISRLVEARPEELRSTIEEAAGISKYKERRRETENRLRRTQENLERLDDIREELDKQLERLKRQAEAARRYQRFQDEAHRLRGELAVLRERALRGQLAEETARAGELETLIEKETLGLRACETQLVEGRETHDQIAQELERHQASFYETGAAIARLEQSLEHARQRDDQLATDLEAAYRERESLAELVAEDERRRGEIASRLEALAPDSEAVEERLEALESRLAEAEAQMNQRQQAWEEASGKERDSRYAAEREQATIQRLERLVTDLDGEIERRRRQRAELPDVSELKRERDALVESQAAVAVRERTFDEQRQRHTDARDQARQTVETQRRDREDVSAERHRLQGEIASLDALIDAALTDSDAGVADYLADHALARAPRLAERLDVEAGWERTVSWVLGPWLHARLGEIDQARAPLEGLISGELPVVDTADVAPDRQASTPSLPQQTPQSGTLADKVAGAGPLAPLLDSIHCAEALDDAWRWRERLAPGESVITAEGLWLGRGWARRLGRDDAAGDSVVLQRQRRATRLARLETLDARIETIDAALAEAQATLASSEAALEASREEEAVLARERQQAATRLATLDGRLENAEARAQEIDEELAERRERCESTRLEWEEARERWQQALTIVEAAAIERGGVDDARRETQETLDTLRREQQKVRAQHQAQGLECQRLETQRSELAQQLARSRVQLATLDERCESLQAQREALNEPDDEQRERLASLLDQRSREEQTLEACRDRANQVGESLRQAETDRQTHERTLNERRERLQEVRMQVQALTLKAEAQAAQLEEARHDRDALLDALDPAATESAWQARLDETLERIRRLGAINLAAIEEYDQQAERRDYLEAQHAELSEAIETLERAIKRIDQETRSRFKQTFEQVNDGLAALFPRVFGGGAAWLTLTGEDLLETGVAIMARPPGKKNSTIHLLSGGEKALTALSLVFAIFQLNPAPFCMLDEVDAPLDDANVGRYARLVKEMSESVQFIFITHNKIAMEAAERLMGVTMQEPGVSRLVSVGVDEAASLAESA
ncbi:chromosome segregation protein SMC [Salinicola aestuarinus]|uniref:chromosome segregation protein SMC n=1 Tax=Salinicola aestuarinus TaxID=1949082 RepID=UPI000DA20A57|nr:chromosome segregation protein SMC [Salinicola aestuarinus]